MNESRRSVGDYGLQWHRSLVAAILWGLLFTFCVLEVGALITAKFRPSLPLEIYARQIEPPDGSDPRVRRFEIHLKNLKACDVRILGAGVGCGPRGCMETTKLPLSIRPFGETKIDVTFTRSVETLKHPADSFVLDLYIDLQTGYTLTVPVDLSISRQQ
jgi:hypothetical protein